ncbi:1771_t:CDS:2, partial [Racocetra persica]
ASKRNLCKKDLYATKKGKIGKPDSSIVRESDSIAEQWLFKPTLSTNANQIEERTNIFYNPLKADLGSDYSLPIIIEGVIVESRLS